MQGTNKQSENDSTQTASEKPTSRELRVTEFASQAQFESRPQETTGKQPPSNRSREPRIRKRMATGKQDRSRRK